MPIVLNMVLQEKAKIIEIENLEEYKCFQGLLDLLIPARMHPAILASSSLVPFVSIMAEHKQEGLLKKEGSENTTLFAICVFVKDHY